MEFDLFFIGLTLETFGKVMVVLAVLHMHRTMVVEHKIDTRVILTYKQERKLTWLGLLLIVSGYIAMLLA